MMNRSTAIVTFTLALSVMMLGMGMLVTKTTPMPTQCPERIECNVYTQPFVDNLTMEVEVCGKERKVRVVDNKDHKPTYWIGPVYTDVEARMVACVMLSDACPDFPHDDETHPD